MATRIGNSHKPVTGKDGKVRLVEKPKRYDVSKELKRKNSKKVRVVKIGKI